jgi:hypothetical protein
MATATKVLDAGVVASACLPMENVKHTTWLTGNAIITRNQNNGLSFILSLYCSRFFCMLSWPELKPAWDNMKTRIFDSPDPNNNQELA